MIHDNIAENFLSKYDIKGKPIYAKILWRKTKDHLFHIKVYSEEQSWSGKFSHETSKTFSDNIDENDDEYSNNVKDALKIKDCTYIYDLTPVEGDRNGARFYWKKRITDSTATIIHGFVTLKKDEVPGTKGDIIDFLIDENKNLCLLMEGYKEQTKLLNSDLETWKNEFEKFVDIKNSLETTLYGKFVQLLNSKKQRIQELENYINDS